MGYCKKCGNPLVEQAKFCGTCGEPVGLDAAPPQAAPAATETPPQVPSTTPPPEAAAVMENQYIRKAKAAATAVQDKAKRLQPTLLRFLRTPSGAVATAVEEGLFASSFFILAAEILLGGLALVAVLFGMRGYLGQLASGLLGGFGLGLSGLLSIPVFTTWLCGALATVVGIALRLGLVLGIGWVNGTKIPLRSGLTASNLVGILPAATCVVAAVLSLLGVQLCAVGVLLWWLAGWLGAVVALKGLTVTQRDDLRRWLTVLAMVALATVVIVLTRVESVKLVLNAMMNAR